MMNAEMMRKMRDAEKVQMKMEKKKVGEKGKKKEKRVEKQREEAERNRQKSRMKDWLSKRNLCYGNASYGNASGMEHNDQDVAQNVAEIVGSFGLEKLEEQQPVQVNVGGQALEGENLVSREQGN